VEPDQHQNMKSQPRNRKWFVSLANSLSNKLVMKNSKNLKKIGEMWKCLQLPSAVAPTPLDVIL
jgi:hypothetical protein